MLISLTLAPLAKTQLKSEFLPILLRVNAYQFCIPFCFSTEQNRTNRVDWVRLGSVIELNRTHKKAPVRLCSIAEPIELQSNDWVRLVFGSVSFDWLRRVLFNAYVDKICQLLLISLWIFFLPQHVVKQHHSLVDVVDKMAHPFWRISYPPHTAFLYCYVLFFYCILRLVTIRKNENRVLQRFISQKGG